ncbi:MAG: hypothetical protein ACM3KE_13090, partial [Hyphomicrobiales bacterium]
MFDHRPEDQSTIVLQRQTGICEQTRRLVRQELTNSSRGKGAVRGCLQISCWRSIRSARCGRDQPGEPLSHDLDVFLQKENFIVERDGHMNAADGIFDSIEPFPIPLEMLR